MLKGHVPDPAQPAPGAFQQAPRRGACAARQPRAGSSGQVRGAGRKGGEFAGQEHRCAEIIELQSDPAAVGPESQRRWERPAGEFGLCPVDATEPDVDQGGQDQAGYDTAEARGQGGADVSLRLPAGGRPGMPICNMRRQARTPGGRSPDSSSRLGMRRGDSAAARAGRTQRAMAVSVAPQAAMTRRIPTYKRIRLRQISAAGLRIRQGPHTFHAILCLPPGC